VLHLSYFCDFTLIIPRSLPLRHAYFYLFLMFSMHDLFHNHNDNSLPIPAAARSKAWVCGRSLAGIMGSNPAGGMDVCLL
jgi:hypothetical protein